MIPFGIVSAQRLFRPAASTEVNTIVMDFLNETYTVDGVAASAFDLLENLNESHITANGLGGRETAVQWEAKGPLFTSLKNGLGSGLQVIVDWQITGTGTSEATLLNWLNDDTSYPGTYVIWFDSLADWGLDLYDDGATFDAYTGADTGYNTSFAAKDTIQRGGMFFRMLNPAFPSRRYVGVALNDAASAQVYTETDWNVNRVQKVLIGGMASVSINYDLYITRLEVAPLAFDYTELANFSALTAYP